MSETPFPVPEQTIPLEDRPGGEDSETGDEHSISGSNRDYSQSSGRSESEKGTNGTSHDGVTGGSGSEISEEADNNLEETLRKTGTESSKAVSEGEEIEECGEKTAATIVTLNDDENSRIEKGDSSVESQLPKRTDHPERALRSRGAARPIQLGKADVPEKVTAAAWISRSAGTSTTIPRGEERRPGHRYRNELEFRSEDASLKTLTVGQEDNAPTPLPRRGVEQNQREPADGTGISGAASGRDSPKNTGRTRHINPTIGEASYYITGK